MIGMSRTMRPWELRIYTRSPNQHQCSSLKTKWTTSSLMKMVISNSKVVTTSEMKVAPEESKLACVRDSFAVEESSVKSDIRTALKETGCLWPRSRKRKEFNLFGIKLDVTIINLDFKQDSRKWLNPTLRKWWLMILTKKLMKKSNRLKISQNSNGT